MCGVMHINQVRNEDMRRRTDVMRELAGRAEQSVLRWFGYIKRIEGEPVGEENSRIRCERCEVERKAMNGMDEWMV